ncbi:MAG: caspase domain-containing protein [Pseudorhodoplanes sp.]|uniref:caspase family protein n=1 Tax=Pseudorhodoplanes sp. TaxID=1934341 RepID=UPI003D10F54E
MRPTNFFSSFIAVACLVANAFPALADREVARTAIMDSAAVMRPVQGPLQRWAAIRVPDSVAGKGSVALVVGINNYQNLPKLKNAVNDATAVADMLRAAGFDQVIVAHDPDDRALRATLGEFNAAAEGKDIALIYFAGQGVRLKSKRLLFATDVTLDQAKAGIALTLDDLQAAVPRTARVKLIAIDACQDELDADPKARTEPMLPVTENAPIFYSSTPYELAQDGEGTLSPFATAFVRHFAAPGQGIRDAANRVRDDVVDATKGAQTPVLYGYVERDLQLLPSGQAVR